MKKMPCLRFENRASISCRNENVAPESEISKRTKQVQSRRHEPKQDRAYRYVLNLRSDSIEKHHSTLNNGLPCLKLRERDSRGRESTFSVSLLILDKILIKGGECFA